MEKGTHILMNESTRAGKEYTIPGELVDDLLAYVARSRSDFPSGSIYNLIVSLNTLVENTPPEEKEPEVVTQHSEQS